MNSEEGRNPSKPKNVQGKVKTFSKENSKRIIAEIRKRANSSKRTSNESAVDETIMLAKLSERPTGLTEVRRDGKDNNAVVRVIQQEFKRCQEKKMSDSDLITHMQSFTSACWVCNHLVE